MLVEFVGTPGVGKSTIARLVVERLRRADLRQARAVELTGYFGDDGRALTRRQIQRSRMMALAASPRLSREVARCWRSEGRGLALSWMVNLTRRNHMARIYKGEDTAIILEEGVLSALCLAKAARRLDWNATSILPILNTPDVVISLRAPVEETYRRVVARQGILGNYSLDELRELQSAYVAAQDLIEDAVDAPVFRYSTVARTASEVADQVIQKVGSSARR